MVSLVQMGESMMIPPRQLKLLEEIPRTFVLHKVALMAFVSIIMSHWVVVMPHLLAMTTGWTLAMVNQTAALQVKRPYIWEMYSFHRAFSVAVASKMETLYTEYLRKLSVLQ